jgi:amino acid transporter
MKKNSISIWFAILSIINIMIGSGLFLNTNILLNHMGALSPLIYIMVGILIIPLIVISYMLLQHNPEINMYILGNSFSKMGGTLLSWAYFLGKMGTVALGILIGSKITLLFLPDNCISIHVLAMGILFIYGFFMSYQWKIGRELQFMFLAGRLFTILYIVKLAFMAFNKTIYIHQIKDVFSAISLNQFFAMIPFIIFSFMGFESFFSVASSVKDYKKNAPLVVGFGFFSVLILYFFYQAAISILSFQLNSTDNFINFFDIIIQSKIIKYICLIGVSFSALGVSYGALYNNIFTLMNIPNQFKSQKKASICAILIVLGYVLGGFNYWSVLQQMSILGTYIVYLAFYFYFNRFIFNKSFLHIFIRASALVSLITIGLSICYNAYMIGFVGYLVYMYIISIMYMIVYYKNRQLNF